MKKYDVVIAGGATTGSYFARRMAEKGARVLVLDKKSEKEIGAKYDIFHIAKADFKRFNLPMPEKDADYAFEFSGSSAYSSFGRHPKEIPGTIIGMHMHDYTLRLNRWAKEAGAEYLYEAEFKDFLYRDGKICGVRYMHNGKEEQAESRLVADCSGIPSAARTKLPDNYGVENFQISPADMFYVTLRYCRYLNPENTLNHRSWPFYKTWEAPEADPEGFILGVGANFSFDCGEKIFSEFEGAVKLPAYRVKYTERGTTPYRRPPYSFVADGFIVMGDAACLTKPSSGEGVTSSMVQADIAIEEVSRLLSEPGYLSGDKMWGINKRYIEAQGKAFASQLATLLGAVATNAVENDFLFKQDIIFTKESFQSMGCGKPLVFSAGELLSIAAKMAGGVVSGKLRIKTIKALLAAMKKGDMVMRLYSEFPEDPEGFGNWVKRAEALWPLCLSN